MDFVWKLYGNTIVCWQCCTCNGRVSRCCHIESSFTGPPPLERRKKKKKKKKKEKNSCTKNARGPATDLILLINPGPKYVLIWRLQAFVTFTQNSFFEYIWCYVFINSYSHNNFSRPISCWLYCLVFNSIQNHTKTCIQNCMEFQCPLYLPE